MNSVSPITEPEPWKALAEYSRSCTVISPSPEAPSCPVTVQVGAVISPLKFNVPSVAMATGAAIETLAATASDKREFFMDLMPERTREHRRRRDIRRPLVHGRVRSLRQTGLSSH